MKIPIYEQQIAPSQNFVPPRLVAEQSGAGMAQIGEGLMNLAGALNDREKRKAEAWFAENSSVVDQSINQMMNDDWKKVQPGADGWTKSRDEAITKITTDAVANAPLYARERLKAHLGRTKESTLRQAMQMENAESYRHMGQQFENGVDISAKLVSANSDLLYDNLGKAVSSAEAIGTTPEQRASLKEIARAKLASHAVMGSIDKNPNGNYEEAPGYSLLTIEEQAKAQSYAKQKKQEFQTQKLSVAFNGVAMHIAEKMPVQADGTYNLAKGYNDALAIYNKDNPPLDASQKIELRSSVERELLNKERNRARADESRMALYQSELDKSDGNTLLLKQKYPEIDRLAGDKKDIINNYAAAVHSGGTRISDHVAFGELYSTPDLLKQTNLDAIKYKFNSQEFNHLVTLKEKLLKGLPEQNLVGNATLAKRLSVEAGYATDEDHGKILSLVQSAINQERDMTGREVSQKRVEELTNDVVYKKVKEDHYLGFIDKKLSPYDLLKETDPEDMAQVDAKLTERGMELSDINRARMLAVIKGLK